MATIVFEGDSLTAGADGSHAPDYYVGLPTWEGKSFTKVSDGHPGETLIWIRSNLATNVFPHYDSTSDMNLVVLQGGINDLAGGATANQAYCNLEACCVALRSFGFKVLVWTMFSANGYDSERDAFNSLVYGGWRSFCDGIVDLASNGELGSDGGYANDEFFQPDGIHLTDAGYSSVAEYEQSAIADFLKNVYKIGSCVERKSDGVVNFPASGVMDDATSFTLPAGEWDVSALIYGISNGATIMQLGISTTAGNSLDGLLPGDNYVGVAQTSQSNSLTLTIPAWRITLSQPKEIFMKVLANYTGTVPQYAGRLSARMQSTW